MRISKIDYATKTITLDGLYDIREGDVFLVDNLNISGQLTYAEPPYTALSGTLRCGPTWIADGIDENGNLINPRREND